VRSWSASASPWQLAAWLLFAAAAWWPLAPLLRGFVDPEALAFLGDARRWQLLGRTVWMSAAAAGIAVLLGTAYAALCVRVRFPGARVLESLLPLPLFVPPLLLAQAWFGLAEMRGPWAAVFTLGVASAPLPGLLAARSLRRQRASAHESALLLGPAAAVREMLRTARPAALLGGLLAFVLAASDFAVPDYFAVQQPLFHVYAMEVFGHSRSASYADGAAAALPLVLLGLLGLAAALHLQRGMRAAEIGGGRAPTRFSPPPAGAAAAALATIALATLLVLLPVGRLIWETGNTGPLDERSWAQVSADAFTQVFDRARGDFLSSLRFSALAALIVLAAAPFWSHGLLHAERAATRAGRAAAGLLAAAVALPLLVPAVALGFGAILTLDRPGWRPFYDSPWLPALLLAGRYGPIAIFLLLERLRAVPDAQEESALIGGASYPARLFRYRLRPQAGGWILASALVFVFAMRELDLNILVSPMNASASVRYYNALHFARDNFVAACSLVLCAVLWLPTALAAAWSSLRDRSEA
jgi:ABC-type Fe3+ transport system permease subunit